MLFPTSVVLCALIAEGISPNDCALDQYIPFGGAGSSLGACSMSGTGGSYVRAALGRFDVIAFSGLACAAPSELLPLMADVDLGA